MTTENTGARYGGGGGGVSWWTTEADQTTKWIKSKEDITLSDYIASIGADNGGKAPTDETIKARGLRYGHFRENAEVANAMKDVVRDAVRIRRLDFEAYQLEGIDAILNKISRIVCGDPNYVDSWHDIAGYALLVEKILNGENP